MIAIKLVMTLKSLKIIKKQVENQDGQINQQVDNAKENIKNNQKN